MKRIELANLREGDIVRSKVDGVAYIVTGNYGTHITAVRTADLTNPEEWDLVQKANREMTIAELSTIVPVCIHCGVGLMQPHRPGCPVGS